MRNWNRTVAVALAALASLIAVALADSDATITLSTNPQPPDVVENPGGQVEICWRITYSTTPQQVIYKLLDPTLSLVETETYPGGSGVELCRNWEVPSGMPGGAYWVRVEFYSVEAGNEANAEFRFFVGDPPASGDAATWGRIKALF